MQYCCDFRAERQRCDFSVKTERKVMQGGRIGMMRTMQEKISKDPSVIRGVSPDAAVDLSRLADAIKAWGKGWGFQEIFIADANAEMTEAESGPLEWLGKAYYGERDYMAKHGIWRTVRLNSFPGRCE